MDARRAGIAAIALLAVAAADEPVGAAPAAAAPVVAAPVVAAPVGAAPAVAPPAHSAWRSPVAGAAVLRVFDLGPDPFEGGRHRGVDLAARAGDEVRAPCAGIVVVAGFVGTSGRVVTIRCGLWRVSHMPLGEVAVRPGAEVGSGALLGTAAPSRAHAGLHLGVRREGRRFGYVDPLLFLGSDRHPPPPVGGRPPRLGPAPRTHGPLRPAAPPAAARPRPLSRPVVARRPVVPPRLVAAHPASRPGGITAPWPAWAGLALVLGSLAAGWRIRIRSRGARARGGLAEGLP